MGHLEEVSGSNTWLQVADTKPFQSCAILFSKTTTRVKQHKRTTRQLDLSITNRKAKNIQQKPHCQIKEIWWLVKRGRLTSTRPNRTMVFIPPETCLIPSDGGHKINLLEPMKHSLAAEENFSKKTGVSTVKGNRGTTKIRFKQHIR